MADSPRIQNLLQTGYFTTSRAKSNAYPTSPRPQAPPVFDRHAVPRLPDLKLPARPSFPPPASVEDEAVSLAREHGAPASSRVEDEEPPSRGEIEQCPIIREVHEYNPERRFVILNDELKAPADGPKPNPPGGKPQKPAGPGDDSRPKANRDQKYESAWTRAEGPKTGPERRGSGPDLPPLQTDLRPDRPPEHHRSRSTASAGRPDYVSRQSRMSGDQLLSPEIIQSGAGGREKAYRGLGPPSTFGARPPTHQDQFETSDRKGDGEYHHHRRRRTASMARRYESSFEASKPSRRLPDDWAAETRLRKDQSSTRSDRRDKPRSYTRSQGPAPREKSRSCDERPKGPRTYSYTYMQKTPIVVQESRQAPASTDKGSDAGKARSRSRMGTAPLPSPLQPALGPAVTPPPRSSATFPIMNSPRSQPGSAKVQLPYPDDDDFGHVGPGTKDGDVSSERAAAMSVPSVSMPEPLPAIPASPERPPEAKRPASPAAERPGSWQPPPFDPGRNGARPDRPVGSYRRFSKARDNDGSQRLPECPRTTPVAGMIDWLTLPRTDFNICPTCYEAVFAKSEFRTHFQPILRPTGEAIACDFGSSPWYRIAWLLTLKHEKPNLRLLYQVAAVTSMARGESCPGSRKATRNWLAVRNPYTRRAVPEFAVCYQCARTVEALLANLAGVFVPLDSRSEPTRDICALHLTPKRRQFVLYFDAFETTSDKAFVADQAPDIADLAEELRRLSIGNECREDSPVRDGYWHVMQLLPELTVCNACFDEVVRPRLEEGNSIAHNFFMKPQRLPSATCQLYSARMRDIFQKACRRRDHGYLEAKVLERRRIEAEIYDKLLKLDRAKRNDAWTEEQVEKLIEEWRRWE